MIPLMLQHPLVYSDDTLWYVTQVGHGSRERGHTFADVAARCRGYVVTLQFEHLFVRLTGQSEATRRSASGVDSTTTCALELYPARGMRAGLR
jgi:hypothetical protein